MNFKGSQSGLDLMWSFIISFQNLQTRFINLVDKICTWEDEAEMLRADSVQLSQILANFSRVLVKTD